MMETVHIALSSDENYVIGLTVTAGSIAYHASRNVKLMMHILDGGIKDDTFAQMAEKIHKLHPHVEFHRISVDENLFRNYPVWSGNKMTYARLLLADALPDVSHIIYSDTDFLWLIDIAELWHERSSEEIFLGVQDHPQTIAREEAWAKQHDLPFDNNRYFGAGLSFYNLDKFREEGIIGQVAEFLRKYPDVSFADQTALNHLLRNRVKFLPQKWQTLSIALTRENVSHPLAIHYGGDIPWRRDKFWTFPISDSTLLWYAMLDHINGQRPGTSIKSHLTTWQRIYKRALANICRHGASRSLFNILLKATGRRAYISNFDKFARDLGLSKKALRQRILNRRSV